MVGVLALDLRDEVREERAVVGAAEVAGALLAVVLLLVVAAVALRVRQSKARALEKSIVMF